MSVLFVQHIVGWVILVKSEQTTFSCIPGQPSLISVNTQCERKNGGNG